MEVLRICLEFQSQCGCCVQQRALLTYIKRVYYPFLVRDPELVSVGGNLCALWLHSLNCSRTASVGTVVLGVALVIPSLQDLPSALTSIEDLILQSGKLPFCTSCWS